MRGAERNTHHRNTSSPSRGLRRHSFCQPVTERNLKWIACEDSAAVNAQCPAFFFECCREGVVLSEVFFAKTCGIDQQTFGSIFQVAKLRRSIEREFFFFRCRDSKNDDIMPVVPTTLQSLSQLVHVFETVADQNQQTATRNSGENRIDYIRKSRI